MSKVLVDRELLERLLDEGPRSVTWAAQEEARAILAQPAEAEGELPEPYGWIAVGELYMIRENAIRAAGKTSCICVYTRPQLLAALSAVTAERDMLQAALDDPGYQPKHARRLIAQLRAEIEASRLLLEQCNEVIAEDGGVYIELRAFLAGTMPASDVIALLRDAAMAAKGA